jgi:cytochrome P450
VIGRMLGFPEQDEDLFREFVHTTLERINEAPGERSEAFSRLEAYIDRQVAEHVDDPRDDLTTYLLDVEIEGNKLSADHVRGTIILLLIAGIDTTWSAIGSSLWHLDSFVIDRAENRHAAFGLGIHRCLGSNLARLELKVAIEEFVARFPHFELAGDTRWSVGMIRGPRALPVRILETA